MRPLSLRLLPALGAICVLVAGTGCSERVVAPRDRDLTGFSLLQREPDGRFEQPGTLLPDLETGWDDLGPSGWVTPARRRADDLFVWSRVQDAKLLLPSLERADRTIELTLWCPLAAGDDPDLPQTARVRLNGILLGEIEINRRPRDCSLDAPAPAWVAGDNELSIEVEELRKTGAKAREGFGVGLARVSYAEARVPELDPESAVLELADSTGVAYLLEEPGALDLRIVASATAAGTLRVGFRRVDVASGAPQEVLEELELSVMAGDEGGVDRRVPIPSPGDDLFELFLEWQSEGGQLAFERLDILDREDFERFPVVFIALDTYAGKHTSLLGYDRETTPNLKALAGDGVVFEHCTTNAPWTLPSFLSIMSGVYAKSNRVVGPAPKGQAAGLWDEWRMAPNRWTLAEAMRGAGWYTASFVDNPFLSSRYSMTDGFVHYDGSAADFQKFPPDDPNGGIRQVTRALDAWLRDPPPEPLFLFVHCFDAHGPYKADGDFRGMFEEDGLWETDDVEPAGGVTGNFGTVPEYITKDMYPEGVPAEVPTGPITARYDEGVAMTDHGVGRLLDLLRQNGLYDDALIILGSDHGETMAESDYLFGHTVIEEKCAHVPLIMKLPGNENAGHRVAQTVQNVDIYPTILDLVGLPADREYLHGRSLAPLLRGEELEPVPTYIEEGLMDQSALYYDGWKLVVRRPGHDSSQVVLLTYPDEHHALVTEEYPEFDDLPFTEEYFNELKEREGYRDLIGRLRDARSDTWEVELYRVREDPLETEDLADRYPEKVDELAELLKQEQAKRDAAQALASVEFQAVELSEEQLANLKALGYVDHE